MERTERRKERKKFSPWYYVDFGVSFLACFFSFFPSAFLRIYSIVFVIELVCFVSVSVLIYGCKKPPESKPGRVLMRTVRVMVYTAALAGAFLFFRPSNSPVLYPVDKAVVCFNYINTDEFYFLPDKIPSNAGSYKMRYGPEWADSDDLWIELYTDTAQLEEYRNFARRCGAVKSNHKECCEFGYTSERAGKGDVEVWDFPQPGGGGYRATYYICPESGYFIITW